MKKFFFHKSHRQLVVLFKDEKRIAIKKAKEELEQWLQNHPKVRATMRYSKAESLFANEPEWKAVHDSERKEIFRDAMVLFLLNDYANPFHFLFSL